MSRSVPASFFPGMTYGRRFAVALTAVMVLACASDGALPHPDLVRVWREFLALPAQRALAIAGDPGRDHWVAAYSGGHATRDAAEAEALSECQTRRGINRMQAECVLYAVGDEIVWRGR